MKKLLILVLIALLLTLILYVAIEGVKIGNLEILGIKGIQEKNLELEQKIEKATKLASTDYKKAVSTVEENSKKLEQEKTRYEEMIAVSTEGEIQQAAQLPTYEIEYLWTKIGNHAKSENTIIKIDVTKGSNTVQNSYNLKFTVNGEYVAITDFVSDIENDSSLGFKIEEFKMSPGDGTTLSATFTCKDIVINDISQTAMTTPENQVGENANNTNTTNTTNSTNTTNTTNTTNNTSTSNTSTTKNTTNTNE